MKNTTSKTSTFLAHDHALLFTISLLLTQFCFVQSDARLISKICKQTPYYNLCVSSLKSNPRSSNADTTGLALIMVDLLKARVNLSLNFIHRQLRQSPRLKQPLSDCADMYNAILTADVPVAIEALVKGDPKFAEQSTNDAANEANTCEAYFDGKSPMTNLNNLVHDTSAIASAITRLLL